MKRRSAIGWTAGFVAGLLLGLMCSALAKKDTTSEVLCTRELDACRAALQTCLDQKGPHD